MTSTERPQVGLLILDLDNTVWDWFDAWNKSFRAMLEELVKVTSLPLVQLKSEIKEVHERRGTSEYSWLLDELPSLKPLLKGKKARQIFDSVLHAQNSARKHSTRLYPGVIETLQFVKSNGVQIVAYTESLAFWTEWRMRLTGLDGIIDILYSSPDHDFPQGETVETVRTLPESEYGLRRTEHRHVARSIVKPDSRILREILEHHAQAGRFTVYVGDSLDKDIEMAQSVGIIDVHAEYGEAFRRPEYELLRELTHWKNEEVEKEKSTDVSVKAVPTFVLRNGFYELLTMFDFVTPFNIEAHILLWKESVDVQMHFNEIGWRIRAIALTALTFVFGATGLVYANVEMVNTGWWRFSVASIVPIFGLVLWWAFWFMDAKWFHRLLIGAVLDGARLEKLLNAHSIEARLGEAISRESQSASVWPFRTGLRSTARLNLFYRLIAISLALITIVVLLLGFLPLHLAGAS